MVRGDGGSDINKAAQRMGLPVDLLTESENFRDEGDGVFPDNATAALVFSDMLTQWLVGPGGAYGLNYEVLPFVYRTRKIKRADQEEVFDCFQIMEQAAIVAIKEQH